MWPSESYGVITAHYDKKGKEGNESRFEQEERMGFCSELVAHFLPNIQQRSSTHTHTHTRCTQLKEASVLTHSQNTSRLSAHSLNSQSRPERLQLNPEQEIAALHPTLSCTAAKTRRLNKRDASTRLLALVHL